MTNVWVLIPAHRPALEDVREALQLLGNLANHVVVVTNGPDPIKKKELSVHVLHDTKPTINISRWWNMGLDWIASRDDTNHHVLVMNADTRINVQGVAQLSYTLDRSPAVLAGPMERSGELLDTRLGPIPLQERVPGYCFMLDSRYGLRADERFKWWCGDDDLQWRAREMGGTLLVGPIMFLHLGDGDPVGELRPIAEADLWRFQEKWGTRPW